MFTGINRFILTIGALCTILWGFVTAMTFGLPESVCRAVDRMTFHRMTREVYQMMNGFYYDVRNNDMPTAVFLIVFGVIFALCFFLVDRTEKQAPQKHSLGLIIFFAVLFRLILLPGELIHENDIYRYIWDAKTTLHKINPYKYAPADVFMYENGHEDDYYDSYHEVTIKGKVFTDDDSRNLSTLIDLRDQNRIFYERIGHWQVPTIYPPAAQVLFALPAMISGNSLGFMKFFFVLFDIATLFLVIALLKHFNMNPCMSVVYGWSPLVCFEIANGGHYDSIAIFFTVLSLLLFVKRRPRGGIWALALATLSKFYAGVLLPILLRPFKMRYLFLFTVILFVFYAPYFLWDETGVRGVFQGLMTYNAQWSYNSSISAWIYLMLKNISPGLTNVLILSKIVAGSLYLVLLGFLTIRKSRDDLDVLHKCFLAVALLFIMNPVADPWYFCWVMPFLCLFPYRSWYLLSGLLMLGYLNFHSDILLVDMKFLEFSLLGWIIYVPFFLYLVKEYIWRPKFTVAESRSDIIRKGVL